MARCATGETSAAVASTYLASCKMPRPGVALSDPGVQFVDANGDGRTDLLVTNAAMSGYFPLSFGGTWDRRSFQRYSKAPSFNLKDPEVKLVDLDGDGVTDAIRSGSRLECFFNDPKEGWNNTRWVERQALAVFPNVNFSDPRVKWADLTGDGLQDIALVYDGNIEYWPNLGRGEWGKRIHMQNSPRFPYGYDPKTHPDRRCGWRWPGGHRLCGRYQGHPVDQPERQPLERSHHRCGHPRRYRTWTPSASPTCSAAALAAFCGARILLEWGKVLCPSSVSRVR